MVNKEVEKYRTNKWSDPVVLDFDSNVELPTKYNLSVPPPP